ncbi:hypothetical protein M8J77_012240 [Diaphorina citri]|nr:hypothetical protein M8J77_012240 [Diaphorina citri]
MEKQDTAYIVNLLQDCLTKVEIISDLTDLRHPNLKDQKKALQHVLQSTMKEIQETGTFSTLRKIATDFSAEEAARKAKISTTLAEAQKAKPKKPRKAQMVEILNRSVRKLIATNKEKHETDLELANLMDDREDKLTLKDIQVNYYSKWYQAKTEQNVYLINKKQAQHQQNILDTTQHIEQEHRVANEIMNFLRKSVQDLNDQLDWWKQKYENDLEQKEIKLKVVTLERDQQLEKLEELTRVYNERKAEIEDYEAIKAEIKRQQDFENYQNQMATKIQAWWRGVMVRRHLGPFKDLARKPKAKIVKAKK